MAVALDRTVVPWLPPVSFAERPELEVMPTAEEIQAKGLDRSDIRRPHMADYAYEVRHESVFLSLPLELRLAVYYWIYLATPVHHARLAPWYPVPYQKEYVSRILNGTNTAGRHGAGIDEATSMLSSSRPLCGMPTNLLQMNREVYHEARNIPFLFNEFVFVNWFSSGIWAARSFTRRLRPWQLASVSQLRLELLCRDLMGSGPHELANICTSLSSGLQGLRLKIATGGSSSSNLLAWSKDKVESRTEDVSQGSVGWRWVEQGISKLKFLRRLEIEVDVPSWGTDEKLEWCKMLEQVLRKQGTVAEVICVENCRESKENTVAKLLEEMAM